MDLMALAPWIALALLLAAIGLTGWIIAMARKAGTAMLLAAVAGFTILWIVGLVNFFELATQ